MNEQIVLFLVAIGTGTALAFTGLYLRKLARRCAAGELERNPMVGVRTTLTMASNEAWFAAHRAAAPDTDRAGKASLTGGILVAASGLLALFGIPFTLAAVAYTALTLATTATLCARVWRSAKAGNIAAAKVEGVDVHKLRFRDLFLASW